MKRLLMLVAVALSTFTLTAAPVSASPYPPQGPTVTTDSGSYAPGKPIIVTATGFAECKSGVVTFTITPPGGGAPIVLTAPLVAGPSGTSDTATVTVTDPGGLGTYTVVATCGNETAATSFAIAIVPKTGSDIGMPLTTGAVLVLVGGGLFVVARRRRQPAATRAA